MTSAVSSERRPDLDWIRVGAFFLLILYHVGMFYVPWDFHVKSPHPVEWLEPVMMLTNPWRLTLLFLVSGAATRFMADKASAGGLAKAWAEGISRQSAVGLGQSLKDVSGGVTLKTDVISGAVADVVKASIKQNVALIKSIPREYFLEIEGEVMRSIQTGRGMADLQPFLEKRYGITKRRAALIARDQTSKATAAINRARMQGLGVKKFKWLHSMGGKEPRPLHKNVLNGNVFSFDDPPVIDERTGERGLPGVLINCRCRMLPVIEFKADDTTNG